MSWILRGKKKPQKTKKQKIKENLTAPQYLMHIILLAEQLH